MSGENRLEKYFILNDLTVQTENIRLHYEGVETNTIDIATVNYINS